jgi:uncharacterized membrane protein YgaE (UPF0421/DUF939 family)
MVKKYYGYKRKTQQECDLETDLHYVNSQIIELSKVLELYDECAKIANSENSVCEKDKEKMERVGKRIVRRGERIVNRIQSIREKYKKGKNDGNINDKGGHYLGRISGVEKRYNNFRKRNELLPPIPDDFSIQD